MRIEQYLDNINSKFQTGKTTEHSFRGDLQLFISSFNDSLQVINEPHRQKCGAPDYIIQKRGIPIGYIETKDIDMDLGKIENSEQLARYKQGLDNLVLTNYLEFIFFQNGVKITSIKIADVKEGTIKAIPSEFEKLNNLLKDFLSFQGQTIKTAKQLAYMMAQKAVLMRDVLEKVVNEPEDNSLKQQMNAFRQILLHTLDEKTFADVYAQTIAYGLFVARLNDKTVEGFSRQEARDLVSKSNPFLRNLFDYISGANLEDRVIWIVDDLVTIFKNCDVNKIMATYGHTEGISDPFLHFYETFLTAYDKATRKKRGVYYTPQPVVKFIIKAVDDILQEEFGLSQGLADTSKIKYEIESENDGKKHKVDVFKVQILDPATGTGTFLAEVINLIAEKFKNQIGMWNKYVPEALIPRLHGFELLMTPYVMCHLKLEMVLKETGYENIDSKQNRFKVYLTNALENDDKKEPPLFAQWLADEAHAAKKVKNDTPIMVVLGNPPYSGKSANGELFCSELESYKQEPTGGKLQEKNPKWLNNDYVKFIRYAQLFIDKNKDGILAYINDNSFLDNPTSRGMRFSLLNSFDKIYILNLHGNAKKEETCPDESKDQNVFNIMQGVSINLFIKKSGRKATPAKVYYADLWGKRKDKLNFLDKNILTDINWENINFDQKYYFFVPKDFKLQPNYLKGFSVLEMFLENSVGVVTSNDKVFIGKDRAKILCNIATTFDITPEDSLITKITYRPFDEQYIYYATSLLERPRQKVMQHFKNKDNIGLSLCRQVKKGKLYQHVFISENIIESSFVSNKTSEITSVFPLYLCPQDKDDFFSSREPNLNMDMVKEFASKIGLTFTKEKGDNTQTFAPIDILDYIYGILHSNKYRQKYNEFLKIDFPRVPYPKNAVYFRKVASLGGQIRALHLLESQESKNLITTYPIMGCDSVGKISYENSKVYINTTQYFDNVPKQAWDFFVGGYQPAQKWLKDRKGQQLSFEDLNHYQQIITALTKTYDLMQEIDKIIEI